MYGMERTEATRRLFLFILYWVQYSDACVVIPAKLILVKAGSGNPEQETPAYAGVTKVRRGLGVIDHFSFIIDHSTMLFEILLVLSYLGRFLP
jgi:hypothetical protein